MVRITSSRQEPSNTEKGTDLEEFQRHLSRSTWKLKLKRSRRDQLKRHHKRRAHYIPIAHFAEPLASPLVCPPPTTTERRPLEIHGICPPKVLSDKLKPPARPSTNRPLRPYIPNLACGCYCLLQAFVWLSLRLSSGRSPLPTKL
ncbi:uncharacterized protein BO80DRAFT_105400 [Aspergillus ibericus CBS 121593]|uniref:Uncharacterized protein n=1 Tax=Aspergillus ibericus CBS 121593 TaxID=1448316 RepID=A0A395GZ50_9EURO|nr:hypothetical protein BO80DRAFT_105400 [Aspergillus ibericus CBS 121593]RAL00315.1 hypothetical protein BO80DRAFT_105400 [Aspergillus ibericus CBS 121593]